MNEMESKMRDDVTTLPRIPVKEIVMQWHHSEDIYHTFRIHNETTKENDFEGKFFISPIGKTLTQRWRIESSLPHWKTIEREIFHEVKEIDSVKCEKGRNTILGKWMNTSAWKSCLCWMVPGRSNNITFKVRNYGGKEDQKSKRN